MNINPEKSQIMLSSTEDRGFPIFSWERLRKLGPNDISDKTYTMQNVLASTLFFFQGF